MKFCAFCDRDQDQTRLLFVAKYHDASAICDECLAAGLNHAKDLMAGMIEYDSWKTSCEPQPQTGSDK